MAIFKFLQVEIHHPQNIEGEIGKGLYLNTVQHFTQFLGQHNPGFYYESCNAGVATVSHPQSEYGQINVAGGRQRFYVLYDKTVGKLPCRSNLTPSF